MTATAANPTATYLKLVKKHPLRSIKTGAELDAATAVLRDLLRHDPDEGGRQYLDALTDLIEVFERDAHPIPDVPEGEMLRFLMGSNGKSQSDVSRETGIAPSTLSAVVRGTRSLTKGQVVSLARLFNVAPAAFLPAA